MVVVVQHSAAISEPRPVKRLRPEIVVTRVALTPPTHSFFIVVMMMIVMIIIMMFMLTISGECVQDTWWSKKGIQETCLFKYSYYVWTHQ